NPSWFCATGGGKTAVAGQDTRRFPVERVSWSDAESFCQRLSAREPGHKYRLPTEVEWEYACRAGKDTAYALGHAASLLGRYSWFADNSRGMSHPVGRLGANAWGLYDLHGNVWEWCADRYGQNQRVLRGGSWDNQASLCRAAYRYGADPA